MLAALRSLFEPAPADPPSGGGGGGTVVEIAPQVSVGPARLKDIPQLARDNSNLGSVMEAVREAIQTFRGYRGNALDAALTRRDATNIGILDASGGFRGGTALVLAGPAGPPGAPGDTYEPDLTAPPTPTGLVVTAGLTAIYIDCDAQVYPQGHGHDRTVVYGSLWATGDPSPPTFGEAVELFQFQGTFGAYPTSTGERWCIWIKWRSIDGVLSGSPAGGTNGEQATTGLIGTSNLGPLVVEAGNLASGAVTSAKLAAAAVDATKFASGIEPMTIVASVPGVLATRSIFNTADGKLYRWNGTAYVATIPTSDLTGQITTTQLVDNAITAVKIAAGQVTAAKTAIAAIDAGSGNLTANSVTATQIAAGAVVAGKLAADSIVAANIQAGAVTTSKMTANTIDGAVITAGTLNASKIVANSITAGQIQAGAISATEIAANAITTAKLLVKGGSGASLNMDPTMTDPGAWFVYDGTFPTFVTVTDGAAGNRVARFTNVGSMRSEIMPVSAGRRYRVAGLVRQPAGSGGFYMRLHYLTASQVDCAVPTSVTDSVLPSVTGNLENIDAPTGWTRYAGTNVAPVDAAFVYIELYANYNNPSGGHVTEVQDLRCDEYVGADLIVDGAISANKIAANAIAVGTLAVQDGALVNAMIANATIDNAKIANLSAAKLTVGDGTVGGNLKSVNYSAGASGWLVTPAGYFEAQNALLRGTVYASAGQIGGITIASNAVRAGQTDFNTGTGFWLGASGSFSIGNSAGNRLTWDGTNLVVVGGGTFSGALSAATGTFAGSLSAATGTFAGSLSAATGTFSGNLSAAGGTFAGSLSAATGTFSGTLTAAAINAVSTVNIAGNAVSAVNSASGTAATISTTLSIPANQTMRIVGMGFVSSVSAFGSGFTTATLSINGTTTAVSGATAMGETGGGPEGGGTTFWTTSAMSVMNSLEVTAGPGGLTATISLTKGAGTPGTVVAFGTLR